MAARPPEISLTAWLDPVLDYFARQAGIPVDQYSSQVGGEGIGTAFEVIYDLLTKGWFNKALQFATGFLAWLYSVFGVDVPSRLRRELLAIGMHELLRVVDMTPSDAQELAESIRAAVDAVRRGDVAGFLMSGLRSPAEVQALTRALASTLPTAPSVFGGVQGQSQSQSQSASQGSRVVEVPKVGSGQSQLAPIDVELF